MDLVPSAMHVLVCSSFDYEHRKEWIRERLEGLAHHWREMGRDGASIRPAFQDRRGTAPVACRPGGAQGQSMVARPGVGRSGVPLTCPTLADRAMPGASDRSHIPSSAPTGSASCWYHRRSGRSYSSPKR